MESTIRRCVREEMRSFRGGTQSLMDRTRHLIQEGSTSVAREIETNLNVTRVNSSLLNGGKRKSAWPSILTVSVRLKQTEKRRKGTTHIPKSVHLIDCLEK